MAPGPAGAPVPPLATRIGLALVAPRRAFELADASGGRAGLTDVATLLVLKFLCVEARAIVAAAWTMVSVGFLPGLGSLAPRLQAAIGLDLLLVFGGGAFLTLAAGKRRSPARDFDLAAVAWLPYLALSLAASLVITVAGARPPHQLNDLIGLVALALLAGWLGMAVRHARQRAIVSRPPGEGTHAGL